MRYLTIILSLICMVFTANAAKADRRVAFVVGNGAYKNVTQLPTPPIDAKAMAGVLRNAGFDVVEGGACAGGEVAGARRDGGCGVCGIG